MHTLETVYTNYIKNQNLVCNRFKPKRAYGIQSLPRQSSSSVYSLYLGAEGKLHRRGANELAWKNMLNLL